MAFDKRAIVPHTFLFRGNSMKEQTRHRNISVEEIAALESIGLVHAGYDKERNREIFHKKVGQGSSADPMMVCREYYNQTKYDLVIRLNCPNKFPPGSVASVWEFSIKDFPRESHVFCPHGYYRVEHRDGTPFEGGLITNYGETMFKHNILLSRPEPKTKFTI